ncbi:MAG: hypothetical protein EBZ07_06760 [Verrucomicrobia bacterium]|nr:hypothetical protein [Verrucomicrobiota bacterium]
MPTLTQHPNTTVSLTRRFPESRPYITHCRVDEPVRNPVQALDPLLQNPHFPDFLKWAFQAVTISYLNPRTRRGLLGDTGFDTFFRQALLLDDQSVQLCIDKEKRRQPKTLRNPSKP